METLLIAGAIIIFVGAIIYFSNIDIWHSNMTLPQKIYQIQQRDKQNATTVNDMEFRRKSKGISLLTPFGSDKKAIEYLEKEYKKQQLINGINNVGFDNEFQTRSKINDLLMQQEQLKGMKLSNLEKEQMIQELLQRLRS